MRTIAVAAAFAAVSLAAPVACFAQTAAKATKPATHFISSIDLAKPFGTRLPWRFIASQAPGEPDRNGTDDPDPGVIYPCITANNGKTCLPDTDSVLRLPKDADGFATPHYLFDARIVQVSKQALLLLQLGSIRADNGDQINGTQVYAYDQGKDSFAPVYAHRTGRNNNQEVRFIDTGPLQGDIISVDPTPDAPFGYWVSVNRLGAPGATDSYKEVLRYRSATAYGDGNPLAVIDAEMPGIQRRMGVWKPGMPLPAPHDCRAPHLVKSVLWCG